MTQQAPYPLRCPHDLMEKLRQEAAKNMRSLHGEIVYRLQQSFKEQK